MLDFLICAGDPAKGQVLVDVLSREMYHAELVPDVAQVLDRLLSRGSRVLVIDADSKDRIPITQVIPIVKKINPQMPIIVMSADQSLEREREVRTLGIFYYLVQPVEEDEFTRAARDALRKLPPGPPRESGQGRSDGPPGGRET